MWKVVREFIPTTGTEKMSGAKVAMPQPNSFQSGALSFMSCTSGRESSPLDEPDTHQTSEFKSETKKKRFHPLRNLRRMFRRKTRRSSISAESYQPGVVENPEINPTNLEHRSCSTSRLQEENLTQNLIRNSRLNPGLSLSHDSIFTPDRADSGLSSSDLENSSLSITVLTPPSKECPIKSQSSCSETSLLSIGSSEVELSPVRGGKNSDLDLGVTAYKLSHSAAKHKMAVKPRRNHGVPRSRRRPMTSKSPLPTTLEVSEEGATGRSSPPLDTSTVDSAKMSPNCDKRAQDGKISWTEIVIESNHGKEAEEKTNDGVKVEEESESKDEEAATHRSESFFGRFLSRRSDKKKKHLQESNAEENNDEKSHFVKKLSKNVEGKGGARKTPNRRQRVEPVEIPSTSCMNKFEKNDDVVGKKISSSVSPPKNFWPNQVTSRSMSPPKVIWPESMTQTKPTEPTPTVWEKVKVDTSPTKQSPENISKDWKNPNFVKELANSVSLFAREKSGKRDKEEEEEEEEEETSTKIRRQHSDDLALRKASTSAENISKNKSSSLESVESAKCPEPETPHGEVVSNHSEISSVTVKTPSIYPISFDSIHDGYENIQIIEQVKQEVRNAVESQPVIVETLPEPEKKVKVELNVKKEIEKEIQTPEKEPEVVRRVKPAVSEKPKDLKRLLSPEKNQILDTNSMIKPNLDTSEPKTPEESDSKNGSKSRNTFVERRKSELMLLTETEEKEWKSKIKPLKKQTSFSETSNTEPLQKSPLPREKQTFTEKTEPTPEPTEEVVILRKKSIANTSDEQPELMKVFARRSLKVRESEKITEEIQRSRDSDKENEIVDSPKEDRKKNSEESDNLISKEGTKTPSKVKTDVKGLTISPKPEIASRKIVFQRYGRSLSENNSKPKEDTIEFKKDSSVLEENNVNKINNLPEKSISAVLEKGEKTSEAEREEEEETGFKRIQQRKAEWERRAQQGAK